MCLWKANQEDSTSTEPQRCVQWGSWFGRCKVDRTVFLHLSFYGVATCPKRHIHTECTTESEHGTKFLCFPLVSTWDGKPGVKENPRRPLGPEYFRDLAEATWWLLSTCIASSCQLFGIFVYIDPLDARATSSCDCMPYGIQGSAVFRRSFFLRLVQWWWCAGPLFVFVATQPCWHWGCNGADNFQVLGTLATLETLPPT